MPKKTALVLAAVLLAALAALPAPCPAESGGPPAVSFRIHLTEEGQSIRDIAGLPWIYGSRLMWPLVYYMNVQELRGHLTDPEAAPTTPLPRGLNLALLLPDEARARSVYLMQTEPRTWVVHVRSVEDARELNAQVIRLVDNGWFTYITLYVTPKERWKRLRVGFFATKAEAEAAGESIKSLLSLQDVWITQADDEEVLRFLGFLD